MIWEPDQELGRSKSKTDDKGVGEKECERTFRNRPGDVTISYTVEKRSRDDYIPCL